MLSASAEFVPVFIDTLDRSQPFERFGESYGSYPVLRVLDHQGEDLAGRLDGNPVRGHIPVEDVLAQLERGARAWRARRADTSASTSSTGSSRRSSSAHRPGG